MLVRILLGFSMKSIKSLHLAAGEQGDWKREGSEIPAGQFTNIFNRFFSCDKMEIVELFAVEELSFIWCLCTDCVSEKNL